ncbi:alpha/beta fold hydrolase [Nocardia fluminea]|uniref:Pimeloyl-ACP methyl ester carboxylesterase n=1 Tax=Nocardia fluminea TaxID=134984 RepID=A0A2N3VL99_9NOCA|nr:alpha/beta fold hydrolase [Nocardia fluminea]PKV82401.1 pimeloyl-ACP methyl ester carboxylesterase [Nocardia fluminea]
MIYKSDEGRRLVEQRYREHLDAWPVPREELRIETGVGETFVVASGPVHAPPLVVLHGSGANASTWRADIADWSRSFRVFAVDLPGEPGFSTPTRLALDSDATATWLDEVLDGLGLHTVALVGMSLGGWTALDYVLRRPARVTTAVLLCPGGLGKHRYGWLVKAIGLRMIGRHSVRDMARTALGLEGAQADPIIDDIELTFTHFSPRPGKLPVFRDEQLREVDIPVLVIAGERDALFDSARTAQRAGALRRGEVRLLPGAGHALLNQTAAVREFVLSHTG